MRLSESQVRKYIELYLKKYGVTLSFQEATEEATKFLGLIRVVESNKKFINKRV